MNLWLNNVQKSMRINFNLVCELKTYNPIWRILCIHSVTNANCLWNDFLPVYFFCLSKQAKNSKLGDVQDYPKFFVEMTPLEEKKLYCDQTILRSSSGIIWKEEEYTTFLNVKSFLHINHIITLQSKKTRAMSFTSHVTTSSLKIGRFAKTRMNNTKWSCPNFYMSGVPKDILCRSVFRVLFLRIILKNFLHTFWTSGSKILRKNLDSFIH